MDHWCLAVSGEAFRAKDGLLVPNCSPRYRRLSWQESFLHQICLQLLVAESNFGELHGVERYYASVLIRVFITSCFSTNILTTYWKLGIFWWLGIFFLFVDDNLLMRRVFVVCKDTFYPISVCYVTMFTGFVLADV